MKMRKMTAMLLAMAMCFLLLAGCTDNATASPDEKVTLTVGYWGSSGEDKAFEKAIEGIMDQFPEVSEVKLQQYPGVEDLYQRLPGEIAAGTAPDIVNITNEQHLQLVDQGLLLPLNDYNLDMSSLSEASVKVWEHQGQQYGIPTTAAPATFAVNEDMWKAAELGDYPSTWDEVYEAAKVLTKDNVIGVCIDIGNIFHPTQYMNSFGGGWNGGSTINSKENVAALEFIFKMFDEGLAITAKDAGKSWDGEVFAAGQVAMSTGGTWYVGAMTASAPDTNYTFIPMPGGDGKSGATLHSYAYALLKSSKNAELAAKVALYMARADYQVANAEITGGRPSNLSVMDKFLELNPKLAVLNDYEAVSTGFNYPADPQFQTDFTSALEGVIYGGETTTAQEILDALQEKYGG